MQYERKKDEIITVGRLIEILKNFPEDSKVELEINYYYEDSDYGKTSSGIMSSVDYVYYSISDNTVTIEGDNDCETP